jgi:hypothetical protein
VLLAQAMWLLPDVTFTDFEQDAVRNLDLRMRDIGDQLEGIHNALAAGGLIRGVIPEVRNQLEEDNGMDDGDGVLEPLTLPSLRVHSSGDHRKKGD